MQGIRRLCNIKFINFILSYKHSGNIYTYLNASLFCMQEQPKPLKILALWVFRQLFAITFPLCNMTNQLHFWHQLQRFVAYFRPALEVLHSQVLLFPSCSRRLCMDSTSRNVCSTLQSHPLDSACRLLVYSTNFPRDIGKVFCIFQNVSSVTITLNQLFILLSLWINLR